MKTAGQDLSLPRFNAFEGDVHGAGIGVRLQPLADHEHRRRTDHRQALHHQRSCPQDRPTELFGQQRRAQVFIEHR